MKIRIYDRKANKIYESGEMIPNAFDKLTNRFLYCNNKLILNFAVHERDDECTEDFPLSVQDPLNKWPETEGMLFSEEYIVIFGEADSLTLCCSDLMTEEVRRKRQKSRAWDFIEIRVGISNTNWHNVCYKYGREDRKKMLWKNVNLEECAILPDWESSKEALFSIVGLENWCEDGYKDVNLSIGEDKYLALLDLAKV